MKKFLSGILATIMLLSVLTVPEFTANFPIFTDAGYLREYFGPKDYK